LLPYKSVAQLRFIGSQTLGDSAVRRPSPDVPGRNVAAQIFVVYAPKTHEAPHNEAKSRPSYFDIFQNELNWPRKYRANFLV